MWIITDVKGNERGRFDTEADAWKEYDRLIELAGCMAPYSVKLNRGKEMDKMNKEQVYDERISPLMTQIIDICKANGIAMIASFAIPSPEDENLCCTTMLPGDDGKNGPGHNRALSALRGEGRLVATAITTTKR